MVMEKLTEKHGINLLLALFKGKEKPRIVGHLRNSPLRFSELQKLLEPISKKVLSTQLKSLEEVGLIERKVFPETPVRVEYSITPLVEEAQPLFKAIKDWEDYYRLNYDHCILSDEFKSSSHPFDLILKILGDKWKPEIIYALSDRNKRFGELKKDLFPISQKVLTQHLRELEHYGFISRTVLNEKKLHVEYALTQLPETLSPIGIQMNIYYNVYLKWKQEKKPLD